MKAIGESASRRGSPEVDRSRGVPWMGLSARTWATAAGILAVGWSIAVAVYVTAAPVLEDDLVDDWEHSRRYLRQLEMIGGKAAVLGAELNAWLAGLWQGRSLAYTIACLTAAVAAIYLVVAHRSRARERGQDAGA